MQKIEFKDVRKTYNGKVGCACGCLGNYTLPSHVSMEEAIAAVGWNAYKPEDVSDRRAKIALTKINKAIDKYGPLAKRDFGGSYEFSGRDAEGNVVWFYYCEDFVALNLNDRATTVYFSKVC